MEDSQPPISQSPNDIEPVETSTSQNSSDVEPIATPKQGEVLSPTQPENLQKPKKAGKKRLLIFVLALALIVAAAAGYLLLFRKKATAPVTTATTSPVQPQKPATNAIIYYSQAKDTEPYKIYSMPTDGTGKASVIYTLDKKSKDTYYSITNYNVQGQTIVFDTNDGVYVSQDAGKTFNNVYKFTADDKNLTAITGLRLSSDGKKLLVAHLTNLTEKKTTNIVKIMDLDGKNVKELRTFNTAGIFLYSYNPDKQQLVYAQGCYFCDGGPGFPRLLDLKTNKDKQLYSLNTDKEIYNGGPLSQDGQNLLYYTGTLNTAVQEQSGGIGWQGAPPYKVLEYNIASGKTTLLATIGKLNEKDSNKKYKEYSPALGYTNDTQKPFYSIDKELYVLNGAKPTLAFDAGNNIYYVPYVTAKKIVAGAYSNTGDANSEYFVYNLDLSTKKVSTILQSKTYTVLMGVTSE